MGYIGAWRPGSRRGGKNQAQSPTLAHLARCREWANIKCFNAKIQIWPNIYFYFLDHQPISSLETPGHPTKITKFPGACLKNTIFIHIQISETHVLTIVKKTGITKSRRSVEHNPENFGCHINSDQKWNCNFVIWTTYLSKTLTEFPPQNTHSHPCTRPPSWGTRVSSPYAVKSFTIPHSTVPHRTLQARPCYPYNTLP